MLIMFIGHIKSSIYSLCIILFYKNNIIIFLLYQLNISIILLIEKNAIEILYI